MKNDPRPNPLNPTAMPLPDAARLLSAVGGQPVSEATDEVRAMDMLDSIKMELDGFVDVQANLLFFVLTTSFLGREWRRDDGAMLRIERCLIDTNWGSSTDVVYQFCRQSAHAGVVMPSHVRFVGASSQPFSEYERRPGDRVGHNWRMPNVADSADQHRLLAEHLTSEYRVKTESRGRTVDEWK